MPQAARKEKLRLTAEDWADAALDAIADGGLTAVAVEPLARSLGVTKGSFYWHFASREALLDATLDRWEASDIESFESSLNGIPDPHQKMRALFQRTRTEIKTHTLFCALFKAIDHPKVSEIMQRVSERRIEYLSERFAELGMNAEEARFRARLTYTSYVGFLQYYQNFRETRMSLEDLDRYVEHVIDTLIPTPRRD